MNILDDITKITVKLLIKEPFYGHFFTYIVRSLSDKTERVALKLDNNGRLILLINPSYWTSLTIDQKFGSIKHQILHLVFRHIYQTEKFGNKTKFNIASDIVVNQYLTKEQRGTDAYTIQDFPFLNLKAGESVGYYYSKLQFIAQDEDDSSDGEDDSDSGSDEKTGTKAGSKPSTEHNEWNSFDEQSGAQQKFVEEKLDAYAKQSADRLSSKDFGTLPLGLQSHIQEATERLQPAVSWKRVLRLYLQSSRKTYIKSTLKRPSRRYGTIPGTQIKHRQKVLVAIDTSASIDHEELSRFFSEIYHIWRQAAEIEIVECDTKIHQHYKYTGHAPEVISGGGGTNFTPPIEWANTTRPDVLIYFTDGHANAPSVPCNCPIIWVVSAAGIATKTWNFLPGRKVKLNES